MKKIKITESELVNLINKVINEAESANCKCCKRGPMSPSEPGPGVNTNIAMINYAQHKLCCKKCKDEQAGMVSSGGRRREFNEQGRLSGTTGTELPVDSPFPKGSTPPHEISQHTPMSHDEFMDGLHDLCPTITGPEKRVGNRSCGRCHGKIMTLLKRYCKSI